METIYKIQFQHAELLLKSLEDVKLLVMEQEAILDMILTNQAIVVPEEVDKKSKRYETAVANALIQVK